MRKVAVLSALALSLLTLSACNGVGTRTPDPETAKALPVTSTLAPAPFDLVTDAAVLERTGLSITLVGRELVLRETKVALNVQFRLPDGTLTFPQVLKQELHREASAGLVVLVGQAFTEPAATITLKPRPATGTGTVTPAQ